MDDALPDEGQKPIHYLLQYIHSLLLGGMRGHSEVLLQVGVAELLDDVIIVGALHDIVHCHDVLGLDLLQDLYLLQEGVLEVLV